MTNHPIVRKYKILEVESERGWGQHYDYLFFDSKDKANDFVEKGNARNIETVVPDYYVRYEYIGLVEGVIIDGKFRELK